MALTFTPKSPMPHKTQGTSCPIKAIVTNREESMKEATIDEVMGATHHVLRGQGTTAHYRLRLCSVVDVNGNIS